MMRCLFGRCAKKVCILFLHISKYPRITTYVDFYVLSNLFYAGISTF
jgi:hypothetical protein